MARIALISCPSEDYISNVEEERKKRFPHLGLLYLATYLQRFGHEIKVFDFWQRGIDWKAFLEEMDRLDPALIGFEVLTEACDLSIELTRRLKDRYPESLSVWGGSFPTFTYEELLQNRSIDFIVRFEGERVLHKLVNHVVQPASQPLEEVKGLVYRRDGAVIANPREDPISDFDSLPFPDRSILSLDEYEFPYTISSTRGCPSGCTFCCARAFWPGKVRYRSAESIFREVKTLYETYGSFEFVVVDDTFTAVPERTMDFCRRIQEAGIRVVWSCESKADVVNRELLEAVYKAGCREIQFGIESGCPDILRRLRKGVTVEQIRNAFHLAHDIGYYCIGSFIIGHPWDTMDTMKRTLDFVLDLRSRYHGAMYVSTNTPFPGCYQYEHAEELGLTIHAKNWSEFRLNNPILSGPHFTLDELRRIFFYSQEVLMS